jgi:hypothetical protein
MGKWAFLVPGWKQKYSEEYQRFIAAPGGKIGSRTSSSNEVASVLVTLYSTCRVLHNFLFLFTKAFGGNVSPHHRFMSVFHCRLNSTQWNGFIVLFNDSVQCRNQALSNETRLHNYKLWSQWDIKVNIAVSWCWEESQNLNTRSRGSDSTSGKINMKRRKLLTTQLEYKRYKQRRL